MSHPGSQHHWDAINLHDTRSEIGMLSVSPRSIHFYCFVVVCCANTQRFLCAFCF